MADTQIFQNSAILAKETLRLWSNNLVLGKLVNYSHAGEFGKGDSAIGTSIRIKREILSGVVANNMSWASMSGITATTMTAVNLVVDSTLSAGAALSDAEMAMKLESFSKQVLEPRVKKLVNMYDLGISSAIVNATVGTSAFGGADQFGLPSTAMTNVPSYASYTFGTYGAGLQPNDVLNAKRALLEIGADTNDLYGVITPYANQTLLQANASLFNTYVADGTEYKNGWIGKYAGIEFSTTSSLASHTNGALSAVTPTAGEASTFAETCTITVPNMGSNLPNPGDVFVVPGVYQVNRINKQITSIPFQVTVLNVISPTSLLVSGIVTAGQYQNASATTMGKTWTLLGATGAQGQESLLLTNDAIYGAFIDLSLPNGMDKAYKVSSDDVDGFKARALSWFDFAGTATGTGTPGWLFRMDVAFGFHAVAPEKIIRIRS